MKILVNNKKENIFEAFDDAPWRWSQQNHSHTAPRILKRQFNENEPSDIAYNILHSSNRETTPTLKEQ